MSDIITFPPVTPNVAPEPGDRLIDFVIPHMLAVYLTPTRVKIMFGDPKDPGNPKKRWYLTLNREQALRLADAVRDGGLMCFGK